MLSRNSSESIGRPMIGECSSNSNRLPIGLIRIHIHIPTRTRSNSSLIIRTLIKRANNSNTSSIDTIKHLSSHNIRCNTH